MQLSTALRGYAKTPMMIYPHVNTDTLFGMIGWSLIAALAFGYLDGDLFALEVGALSGHTNGRSGGIAGNHAANRGDDRSPALPAGRVTITHRCQRISGAD